MDMNFLFTHSDKAMHLLRKLMMSLTPYYKKEANISEYNQFVSIQLFTNLYATSESILFLVREYRVFDADILLRSVIEGSVKYIYLMNGDLETDSEIIKEYYDLIPEMQKLSEHRKAVEALELFKLYSVQKHPFETSILTEEEINLLQEKYPNKIRKSLEQKWGFGTLLKEIVKYDKKYESLFGLYYAYSLSSHFMHQDGEGIKMIYEGMRENAIKSNYELDKGHAVRIISNVLSLSVIRASEYLSKYNINDVKYIEKIKDILEFIDELEDVNHELVDKEF
ncbi:hypothetical protein D2A34_19135 [Clostridium chromiireducens]|uniref:Uncharacterized protein n=1 Tax=Clostridium chromiireducens TaxID=225345 RepID=A0A399IND6_9CLOT|nr:DUF5677 domain-containing protein [Clostridium chromiireducens]RII32952.1 hypothetical protein D2A34_19135 [Clostridium chromiireducens]